MGRIHDLLKAASEPRTSTIRLPGGVLSPGANGLAPMPLLADLFPDMEWPVDRSNALTIPAVSKARNLLVSCIAKFPLRSYRWDEKNQTDTDTTTENRWLYATDGFQSPHERMADTIDDAVFYGCSLWLVDRSDAIGNPIIRAERCPYEWWEVRDGITVVVRDPDDSTAEERELDPSEFILFDFPFAGLLTIGARTLRGARDQELAWVGRAKNPIPLIDLHRTADYVEMEQGETDQMITDWATARVSPNGAIGSTPDGIEVKVYGDVKAELMVEGRNAVRTDVGSFLNIRTAMLDGTIGVDSLTYTTKEGERNAFFEFDLPFWTDPIEARLSMDDVVPRGSRVRFRKYEDTPDEGIPTED
jgi:hypothetical protein